MENIPRDLTSVPDKEIEQENLSWYILTIVMRMGRPSLPEEISEKCTLFRVSPLEVEALCSIPQSPICITGGQMVTCSEIAIFLFHKACGRQVLPFDLVVPDSPVNLSPPSTGAKFYSAAQSCSPSSAAFAVQSFPAMTSCSFCTDSRKEFSTFVHGKLSCHTTSAMISPLTSKLHAPLVGTTNACTTSNLHRDFPVEGQPLMGHFAYFKEGDISSLKCHGKRSGEELFSTEINFRKSSKPCKILSPVGQSVFEYTRETNEYIWHLPDHTGGVDSNICHPKLAQNNDDAHFDGCEKNDKLSLQPLTDVRSVLGHQTVLNPEKEIPVLLNLPTVSKLHCLPASSCTECISNKAFPCGMREDEIVADSEDKECILHMKTGLIDPESSNLEDCNNCNECNEQDRASDLNGDHDELALGHQETCKLDGFMNAGDDAQKIEESGNGFVQSLGEVKIEANLNYAVGSVEPGSGLLHIDTVKPCVNYGCSVMDTRQKMEEYPNRTMGIDKEYMLNPNMSENCDPPVNPVGIPTIQTELSTDNAFGDGHDLEEVSSLNIGLPCKLSTPCHMKSLVRTRDATSQESLSRISVKQKPKRCGRASVLEKCATGFVERIFSQTRLESRDVPVFESFTVEQEEGSGGYGTVYKARRKQDGQIFAIKCPLEKTPKRYVTNEIKMLQRFGGKNFIIKSEGVLKIYEQDCLILKYVPHDKPEVLRREITMLELCWYGFCMFKALATLHKEGIIHRDVKPGNFLFSRKTRRGYLIDFNLAVDQYDTTSDKFEMLPLANRSSGPYAAQMHPLFNRKGNNDRSLAFRKQNMLHLQTESAMPYQSKKLSYSTKKATQVSTKPSSTQWKDREHAAVHGNKRMKTTLVQPSISTDMRSHRKFGRDILNIDGKNKLGSSAQSKNIASGHTPSVGEAVREPLPTQGRKELLSLLQDVCNDSPQQPASFAVSQRKRVAAPQERVARDQNIVRVLSMPLSSNLNVLQCGLNGLANGRDMRKGKRQGPCIGTKGYRAPEVLLRSSHQSPKLDVWSAGISLLYLMVGKSPFPANSTDQAIKDIAKMKGTKDIWELSKLHDRQSTLLQDLHSVGFEPITIQEWCKKNTKRPEFLDCIPMSLYDLVDKCLCVNPQRRLDAEEALNHEFFAHCCEEYEKWRSLREPLS